LLDGSGNTQATYTFDSHGNVTSKTGSANTPFEYTGQYTDSESGLQYLRARYYDPSTAQFITTDPLVASTGEPYAYATDSPLNVADPFGLGCTVFLRLDCAVHSVATAFTSYAGQVRPPDYVTVSLGYVYPLIGPIGLGAAANVTVTRNGVVYGGLGGGPGISGGSVTVEGGWIDQRAAPTPFQGRGSRPCWRGNVGQ
jgi:RHS repeat-associated protein